MPWEALGVLHPLTQLRIHTESFCSTLSSIQFGTMSASTRRFWIGRAKRTHSSTHHIALLLEVCARCTVTTPMAPWLTTLRRIGVRMSSGWYSLKRSGIPQGSSVLTRRAFRRANSSSSSSRRSLSRSWSRSDSSSSKHKISTPISRRLRRSIGGMPRFAGKRVLVTGGDSGIGFAAAQAFYQECADIAIAGHSAEKTRAALAELKAQPPLPGTCGHPIAAAVSFDLTNASDVSTGIQRAIDELGGGLDIAVNAAGTTGEDGSTGRPLIGDPGFVESLTTKADPLNVNVCSAARSSFAMNGASSPLRAARAAGPLKRLQALVAYRVSRRLRRSIGGMPRFAGKRVLVTGGDSGIGFAAAQAFYQECADIAIAGHSAEKTRAALAELKAQPPLPGTCGHPIAAAVSFDLTNATDVSTGIQRAIDELGGGLDIAVNAAGTTGEDGSTGRPLIGDPGFVESLTTKADPLNVNVYGTLRCMSAQLRHFADARIKGSIVNVGSICGEVAFCYGPLYTASKAALIGFSRHAALAYARQGIRINVVDPGFTNTSMLRHGLSPDDPEWLKQRAELERTVPMGRIAEPWELAGPITFLSSDMASYVTGVVLTVDGMLSGAGPGGGKTMLPQHEDRATADAFHAALEKQLII
eukprot:TRINITY_DN6093_c3_g1_i6.p1 TRINITY_DN6093_c3_g1~~TRINITY_DN6093_c3_g1_i6.p1  ORF type:complete len:642 (+),score=94.30 TRINITY_DN6093_c3_g1_i6:1226-3151(+)